MEVTEAEKRMVVKKIQLAFDGLPVLLEAAKKGKITKVAGEDIYIVEVPELKKANTIKITGSSIIVPICPDLLQEE